MSTSGKTKLLWLSFLVVTTLLFGCRAEVDIGDGPPNIPPRSKTTPDLTPTPTPTRDACLLGEWRVVNDSLVAWLTDAIMDGEAAEYELLEGRGWLGMNFRDDGAFSMHAQDLQLSIIIRPESSRLQETTLRMALTAGGEGRFLTAGGKLIAYEMDQEGLRPDPFPIRISETSITNAPVHITPGWFIDQVWQNDEGEIALDFDVPAYFTAYECSADMLWLDAEPAGLHLERPRSTAQ